MATTYLVGGRKTFRTLAAALKYASRLFARTGVIAAVEEKR